MMLGPFKYLVAVVPPGLIVYLIIFKMSPSHDHTSPNLGSIIRHAADDDDDGGGVPPKIRSVNEIFHNLATNNNTTIKPYHYKPREIRSIVGNSVQRVWIKEALASEEKIIKKELKGYRFFGHKKKKWTDFIFQKKKLRGTRPPIKFQNIIFTTWRSGSSFLGEILSSHPATMYYYEPLWHLGVVQVQDSSRETEAIRVIKNLLNCDFKNMTAYLKPGNSYIRKNQRIMNYCDRNVSNCLNPEYLRKMCQLYPFQTVKTVRIRLKLARQLLADGTLNVKILYLVRDPRATMQSRQHHTWCVKNRDCADFSILCDHLVQDYHEAEKLRVEYPRRFIAIRYEDLSTNVNLVVSKIFKFFNLQLHPQVKKYLDTHTQKLEKRNNNKVNLHGTNNRNSKSVPFDWIKGWKNNVKTLSKIQSVCDQAMTLWGYKKIGDSDERLTNFNPIYTPPPNFGP